jgi:hypothetical protein
MLAKTLAAALSLVMTIWLLRACVPRRLAPFAAHMQDRQGALSE